MSTPFIEWCNRNGYDPKGSFVSIDPDPDFLNEGDVVTIHRDDGTQSPYFAGSTHKDYPEGVICLYIYDLKQLTKEDSMLEETKVGDKVKVISKSVGDVHYFEEDKGKELFVTKIGHLRISDDDIQPPEGEPVYTVDNINSGSSGSYYLRKDLVLIKETKQEEQEVKQTFPPQGKVTVTVEHSPDGDSFVVYIVGDIHKTLINVKLDAEGMIHSIKEERFPSCSFIYNESRELRISRLKETIDENIDHIIQLDENTVKAKENIRLIKEMLSQYTGEQDGIS